MGPDTPGTFTPRSGRKGCLFDQCEAIFHMQALDADFAEALIACISGHRMTHELAALCIQTYWRRWCARIQYLESRGAAITIQASFRGLDNRTIQRERAAAAAKLQALMKGRKTRETTDNDLVTFRAAARLQSVWRGHLARGYVEKLQWQSKSRLQRTFSWGKKGKKKPTEKKDALSKAGLKDRSAKDILAGVGVDDPKPKPVKRSMSFDRFSRGVKSIVSSASSSKEGSDTPPPTPAKSKQLLFIFLKRGPNGLGLELDQTNTVVKMVPGGAAEEQGYFQEGDTIASVDGIPLRGRLLQDVMDRTKQQYSFDVWRLTPVEPDPPAAKADRPVRRAFSFDRKKR